MTLAELNDLATQGKLLGWVPGVRSEDYHRGPGHSSTGIITFGKQSAAHYRYQKDNPKAPTAAKIMGNAIHVAILEPDEMDSYIVVRSDDTRGNSNAARTAKKIFYEEHAGKYILERPDDLETVLRVRDAVHAHPVASRLLSGGLAEQSGYWKDPETGLLLKFRSDYLRVGDRISVNLKSAEDASEQGFQKAVTKYRYHWQTGIYVDGLKAITGDDFTEVHLVVEKEPPYAPGIYYLDEAALEKAREEYRPVLERLAECERTNIWPGYPMEPIPMSLPHWAF